MRALRGLALVLVFVAVLAGGAYVFNPFGVREAVLSFLLRDPPLQSGSGSTCESRPDACDFVRRVLGSTEEVWHQQFREGRLPDYGVTPSDYEDPTLVVFSNAVETACGAQTAQRGPFYCFADREIYMDPSFYEVMQARLNAPGDFAQAYVIAHEVGHHVQNLLDMAALEVAGEARNQSSVRRELQADCFAGVWGAVARERLSIDEADMREGLNAAYQFGDDTMGAENAFAFTHGSAAQRMRWFRRGFDAGDARQCDTFRVPYANL